MFITLDELKQKIDDKTDKLKLTHIVWLCLSYVTKYPDSKFKIGIFWFDDSHFMMNTFIFGSFINRKPNTINRNLRTHGFQYKKTTYEMRKAMNESFPDPKNWILRWCDGFTRSTTEKESIEWRYIDSLAKNRKIQKILNGKIKKGEFTENTEKISAFDGFDCFDIDPMIYPEKQIDKKDSDDLFTDNYDDIKLSYDMDPAFKPNEQDYFSFF